MARQEDRLLVSARREALVALAIWLVAGTYSLTFCYLFGYAPAAGAVAAENAAEAAQNLRLVLGMPWWVFWGVVVPWLACTVLHAWFAFGFMGDETLGAEQELEIPGEDRGDLPAC